MNVTADTFGAIALQLQPYALLIVSTGKIDADDVGARRQIDGSLICVDGLRQAPSLLMQHPHVAVGFYIGGHDVYSLLVGFESLINLHPIHTFQVLSS